MVNIHVQVAVLKEMANELRHRLTGWLGMEGTPGGHQLQPPPQAGPPGAAYPGPQVSYPGTAQLSLAW